MSATDEALDFPEVEEVPTATPEGTQSIFDQLRAKRRTLTSEHRIDLDVPGWGGQLVLRMGPVEPRRMKTLTDRIKNANADPVGEQANADLLILATTEVIFRGSDGSEQVMADEHGPIQIDSRLAEGLGLQASTAREVVYGLFAGANDRAFAINGLAMRWIEWAQGADEEVDERFVGEPNGTPPS